MIIFTRALDFSLTPAIRERVESRVKAAVEPVNGRVMIVTARLRDINAARGGVDKRAIDQAAGRLRRAVVEATRRGAARDRRRRPRPGQRMLAGV